jgi:glutaredoxin
MQQPTITVFTTAGCSYCHAEKEYLTSRHLAFTEVTLDGDADAAEAMIARSGQMSVPVTNVKSGDREEQIIGFDSKRLDEILAR